MARTPLPDTLPLPPPSPLPWTWTCHVCKSVYRLGCTQRCLDCGHRICSSPDQRCRRSNGRRRRRRGPCPSQFHYEGWADWGQWRRQEPSSAAIVRQRERTFVLRRHDCSRHCDYPSECLGAQRTAVQEGRAERILACANLRDGSVDADVRAVPGQHEDQHDKDRKDECATEDGNDEVETAASPPLELRDDVYQSHNTEGAGRGSDGNFDTTVEDVELEPYELYGCDNNGDGCNSEQQHRQHPAVQITSFESFRPFDEAGSHYIVADCQQAGASFSQVPVPRADANGKVRRSRQAGNHEVKGRWQGESMAPAGDARCDIDMETWQSWSDSSSSSSSSGSSNSSNRRSSPSPAADEAHLAVVDGLEPPELYTSQDTRDVAAKEDAQAALQVAVSEQLDDLSELLRMRSDFMRGEL